MWRIGIDDMDVGVRTVEDSSAVRGGGRRKSEVFAQGVENGQRRLMQTGFVGGAVTGVSFFGVAEWLVSRWASSVAASCVLGMEEW